MRTIVSGIVVAGLLALRGGGGDDALFCVVVFRQRHRHNRSNPEDLPSQCSSLEVQHSSFTERQVVSSSASQ